MNAIHLLQKDPKLTPWPVEPGAKVFESGYWKLPIECATTLVDKEVYFHVNHTAPSFFGGIITAARVKEDEPGMGRIVFTFIPAESFKNKKTSKAGWKMDMKMVT